MPPKPIEDIDFSDLGEKILEVFRTLWRLICNVCIVIWSYIYQAFSVVWTWPPFETFRNDFTAAVVTLWDYVTVHPLTSAAICILAYIAVSAVLNTLRTCLLHGFGSRKRSMLRGSYAAHYQSTSHGRNVSRDLTYTRLQSHGAKGGSGYRRVQGSPSWVG